MVKSKARAEAKMERGVRAAGPEIEAGMQEAEDPLSILASDTKGFGEKMLAGAQEAVRTGKWAQGIKKAESEDKWKESIPRAKAHYTEAAPRMVSNAMSDYDSRAQCIERAQASVKMMSTTTRADRISKSSAYQEAVAKEFDKLYGRTA